MDNKIDIEDILSEWAFRSPDGLVGGHDTPENIAVLNEILSEVMYFARSKVEKMTPEEKAQINPLDLKYFELKGSRNPIIVTKPDHPIMGDGVSFDAMRKEIRFLRQNFPSTVAPDEREINQFIVNTKYSSVKSNRQKWTIPFLEVKKGFNPNSSQKIHESINNLSEKNYVEFLDTKLDLLSPQDAVEYVNSKSSDKDFLSFMTALDNARSTIRKKSDEESSSGAAGRGEYIMVLLIKDAKSMGQESGDILLPSGKKIDVKEANDIFTVPPAAFGTGVFEKIPYVHAVTDLAVHCQDPRIAKVMLDLIEDAGLKEKIETGKSGRKIQEKAGAIDFVKNPSFRGLNASKITGLESLRQHVHSIKRGEEANAIAADKVEFDIKNTTELLKVTKIEEPDFNKIKNPAPTGSEVKVTVAPIEAEKREMEVILPRIKKFEFFRLDASYDPRSVANEMFDALSTGNGNYSAGIITHFKNKFQYEPDLSKWHDKWKFYGYSRSGPVFKKLETSASKDIQ